MQTVYINNHKKRRFGSMSDILKKSIIIGLGIVFAVIMLKFLFTFGVIILAIASIAYVVSLFRRKY